MYPPSESKPPASHLTISSSRGPGSRTASSSFMRPQYHAYHPSTTGSRPGSRWEASPGDTMTTSWPELADLETFGALDSAARLALAARLAAALVHARTRGGG